MQAKVSRIKRDGVVIMCRGLGDNTWEEPPFEAAIIVDGETVAHVYNSSLLCLPGGVTIRAPFATDAQILEAVLNDEPVM
jgi:hypothetical protein